MPYVREKVIALKYMFFVPHGDKIFAILVGVNANVNKYFILSLHIKHLPQYAYREMDGLWVH